MQRSFSILFFYLMLLFFSTKTMAEAVHQDISKELTIAQDCIFSPSPQTPLLPHPVDIPKENTDSEEEIDELLEEPITSREYSSNIVFSIHNNPLLELLFLYQLQDPFGDCTTPLPFCKPGIYILDCSFLN